MFISLDEVCRVVETATSEPISTLELIVTNQLSVECLRREENQNPTKYRNCMPIPKTASGTTRFQNTASQSALICNAYLSDLMQVTFQVNCHILHLTERRFCGHRMLF